MTKNSTYCGFIAFVGRPNVGKSTIINALTGAKVSIVSRRAQTTRHRIHGVYTDDNRQFVFVDTPGFQTRHGGALNRMMNRVVTQTLNDVDVVVHVVEAGKWTPEDARVISLLPKGKSVILAINKVDQIKNKESMLSYIQDISSRFDYAAVVPVSGLRDIQISNLMQEISKRLPKAAFMFDEDALTDRPMRFLAAEIIREKVFRLTGDELPYGCTAYVEQWEENDSGIRISACILVEKEGHRPILLGSGGEHMKRIATEARKGIEDLTEKKVFLDIYIKVRKGWSSQENILRELGYD